jgi:AmmeMemoRadiSam system protein A
MSSLGSREKQLLLEVARGALNLAAERRESLENLPNNVILQQPGGAFVTLHRRHRLRGCIGQLASRDPLVRVVAYCARAAALEDPRFEPVRLDEIAEIEIELSILSNLEEIAPDRIEVGTHGLVVSRGWQRGVLLPQVAEEFGWTAEIFLEEACVKAGLERQAWQDPAVRIHAFTAEVFSESRFRGKLPMQAHPGYSSST